MDYLNEAADSPWLGRIAMANQDSRTATTNQGTFVKAIKKYVLTANNPISVRPIDQQKKIFLNYWKAIATLLDVGKPTVLYKYNGIELFSRFSTPLFNKLQNMNDFRVSTVKNVLRETFENIEGDNAGVGHPDWWISGTGAASSLNSTAISKIHSELTKALHKVQTTSDIAL